MDYFFGIFRDIERAPGRPRVLEMSIIKGHGVVDFRENKLQTQQEHFNAKYRELPPSEMLMVFYLFSVTMSQLKILKALDTLER